MTPKGHSPVDLDTAAPATSRRGLISALGAAGLASAAALSIARSASAAPINPTESDEELLNQAMQLELTAEALYRASVGAGLPDDVAAIAEVFAENHAAYAGKIAGIAGFSADTLNEGLFDQFESTFATSDVDAFAEAANSLENTATATHTSLMPDYESVNARELTASILVVEARMATVLSNLGDLASSLNQVFEPEAEPLDLTSGVTS